MSIDEELDKLMDDPLLNDVSEKEASLFMLPSDMRNAKAKKNSADYVAQYRTCEDFDRYAPLFQKVHAELKQGRRSVIKISKTASLTAGRFYFIEGTMLFLESVGELVKDSKSGFMDGRTHCVLENGTETDILLQTLRKNVVGNGYGITDAVSEEEKPFMQSYEPQEGDISSGYIYVLSSLSTDDKITSIKNLYKIGFTTGSVEERISNAAQDPTYLLASVKVEASYKIVNMNSHVFESLIHQVLDAVQLQLTVTDLKGNQHHPKEWYIAPLSVIDTIISKIADGTITKYQYNPELQCLERTIVKNKSKLNLSGFKVLTLNIKKIYFDEIMKGTKDIEYREVKQTTINKYTYVDESDGKRYLRRYDLIKFYVGYNKDRESAVVEVVDTTYDLSLNIVEYHLGKILEHIKPEEV